MHRRHLFHVINFYQNDLIIIRCVSLCRKREKIVCNIQSQRKNFHFKSCTGKNRKRNLLVFLAIRIQRVTQAGYSLVYRLRKYSFRKIQKFPETKTMVLLNFSRCPLEWSHSTIWSVPHSSRIYCPETHSSKI